MANVWLLLLQNPDAFWAVTEPSFYGSWAPFVVPLHTLQAHLLPLRASLVRCDCHCKILMNFKKSEEPVIRALAGF